MKKTIQKTLSMSLRAVLCTSAMMWASGQSAIAQSTEQNSVNQATTNKSLSRAVQIGTPPKHDANGVVTADKMMKAQSKEQIMFQRKQAAQKGQPVNEFDNAIKQLYSNQAK